MAFGANSIMKRVEAMVEQLQNKLAAVTGGASGIGFSIAEILAGAGARVALIDVNEAALTASVEALGLNKGVIPVLADVTDEESVTRAFRKIESAFDGLNILVNAAGVLSRGTLEETDHAVWQKVINVDLTSIYLTSRAAVPAMRRAGGGAIVNIASVAGIRGVVNVAYAAAKGGVVTLTKQLGGELAKDNVRVNAVSPGYVVTPLNADMRSAGADRYWIGRIPMRRYAHPREIANVCLFLASDQASYITGANIVVDGGLSSVLLPDPVPFC